MMIKNVKIKNETSNFFRSSLFFLISAFLLLAFSCSKDDPIDEPESSELSVNAKVSGKTVDKAKLQMGKPAKDKSNKPSEKFKGITHDDASFSRDSKNVLVFKAKGKSNRSELRYKNGFSQDAKKTFEAKVQVVGEGKKHSGFTVMQLHNDIGSGPALKIEYHGDSKGNGYFKADYRTKNGAKNKTHRLKDGTSGTFKITFNKRTVTIKGGDKDFSFTVEENGWDGKFYWKTGAYNQKSGQSHSKISNISW